MGRPSSVARVTTWVTCSPTDTPEEFGNVLGGGNRCGSSIYLNSTVRFVSEGHFRILHLTLG